MSTEPTLVGRVIRATFARPLLAVLLVAAGTGIGATWLVALPRDVFPDLSAPVFNVIVQNPAMGAEELETGIAIPMEVGLAGLPDVRRIRSNSQLGVSQVTVEFEANADYYRSRQLVAERVGQVTPQLPPGTDAPLISSLTGRLNEVFELTLEAEPGVADVREAPAVRRGLAHRLRGEVVSCRVTKQFGADTVRVAAGIRGAIEELQRSLPSGVQLRVVYDQSELIASALGGVGRAVLLGAVFVVLALLVLL